MVFKLVESAQTRWRAVNGAHLVPLGYFFLGEVAGVGFNTAVVRFWIPASRNPCA